MATHSSVFAWRITGMREPGGLPSMGLHRVGHDWSDLAVAAAATHEWASQVAQIVKNLPAMQETWVWSCVRKITWKGDGYLLQYSCLENPRDGGAWWAAVYEVAQSPTWLTWLSSSSSSSKYVEKRQSLCTVGRNKIGLAVMENITEVTLKN